MGNKTHKNVKVEKKTWVNGRRKKIIKKREIRKREMV